MADLTRCGWCGDHALYQHYHDTEWGVPLHDDQALFEFLCLEGAQAGLSWISILKKRDNYRKAFDSFDAERIAQYGEEKIHLLLNDAGIIRNKLKINAIVKNARAYLDIKEHSSFNDYIWHFVDGEIIQNRWRTLKQVPSNTETSDRMSKDLKKKGFAFVGPTICYAFMQATGMVNDHLLDCFRYPQLAS